MHAVHRYAKANIKYMKNYDPNAELSYLIYKSCLQMVLIRSQFTRKFMQNYGDYSDKGCILKVDVSCPKRPQKIHGDLLFLPERMKVDRCQEHV